MQSDNGEMLTWTFNPWRDRSGPAWRRPQLALLLTLLIAALAGVSVTYPNYSLPDSASPAEQAQFAEQRTHWPAQAVGWGLLSLAIILGMSAPLYLPLHYRLDSAGVTVRFLGAPSFRKWGHYRNYYFHDTGVHLTTMPQPSPLDPFRGHFLRYGPNREAVRAFIETHMQEWKGQPAAP